MGKIKALEAIRGTHYEVSVERDTQGDYDVSVYKPAAENDPYLEMELVAAYHLHGTASVVELNKLVQGIVDKDHPSLVGEYKDYKEETNDN